MFGRHAEQGHGKRFARGAMGWLAAAAHGHGPGHERGHDHEHRPHREGHRGRRSARVFDHGELRFVVLALIAERPRHGYEIIKAIEERLASGYSPSPGVIYPTLTMLEELGHATVRESEGKKLYAITAEGEAYIAAHKPQVEAALARMDAVSAAHGGGPAPQLVRAVENLKMALRLRQGRGPLTEEQLRSIADALDTAAIAIERS